MNNFPITVFTEGVFDENNKWLPKGTHNFTIKEKDNTVWGKNIDTGIIYKFKAIEFAIMVSLVEEDCPEDCPICLEKITEDKASLQGCVHVFHLNCIKKWLERNRTCPVCRKRAVLKYKHSRKIIPRLLSRHSRGILKREYRKQFASRPNFLT